MFQAALPTHPELSLPARACQPAALAVLALLGACPAAAQPVPPPPENQPHQGAPAQAQRLPEPPRLPAAAPPAVPVGPPPSLAYAPAGEPMAFRLAEGQGPRGANRWVSATGQIQSGTPAAFAAFRRANPVDGLTVVLDSAGGRVHAAMALGRAIRSAGMTTTVGRTIGDGSKDVVRSTDVGCSSACVLVLMGGVERFVPEDARINVHMFSVELDADGNKARGDPSFRDIEQTQRTMARHAVYVAEMGVDARFLLIMTEASFRGTARRMSASELTDTRLAALIPSITPSNLAAWSMSPASAPPQLLRRARLTDTARLAVDHELILECDVVSGFYAATYRQVLARLDGPKTPQPVALASVRLDTGGWDFILRAPLRGLGINTAGKDLWMRRSIPRKVLNDAAANGRLNVEIEATGRPTLSPSLYDPSLARLLPELERRCDQRPGRVSVGPNPRR